jgi:oleandomycin transport system permease protein
VSGVTTIPLHTGPVRIGPLEALRHDLILAHRGTLKSRRDPMQFVDVFVGPVATLVVFLYTFGGSVAGSTATYVQLLVPGLMVQNILLASLFAGVALNVDANRNVVDRFRGMPIGRSAPLVGAVLATTVRSLIVLLVAGTILGFRLHTGVLPVVFGFVLMICAGLCLCWLPVFVGMLARSPSTVQAILVAVVMPLVFGSSVFVPTNKLPGWLHAWSLAMRAYRIRAGR